MPPKVNEFENVDDDDTLFQFTHFKRKKLKEKAERKQRLLNWNIHKHHHRVEVPLVQQ